MHSSHLETDDTVKNYVTRTANSRLVAQLK